MSIIDFKEIPKANTGEGNQDYFELFSRDFLKEVGYTIIEEPARGADGGKDLIVLESRTGIAGTTNIRWLVSCKHFAHNAKGKRGKSVTPEDETNILDRVKSNKCDGFIGFYSTIPSEGLMNRLKGLSSEIGYQVFDCSKIESLIIGYSERENLFLRNFPNSYTSWKQLYNYTEPVKLFRYYFSNFSYKHSQSANIFRLIYRENIENAIKPLKKSSSIEDFFQSQNIALVVSTVANKAFDQLTSFLILHKDENLNQDDNLYLLKKFQEQFILSELKLQENIEVSSGKVLGWGMEPDYEQMTTIGFFAYTNLLIIGPELYEPMKEVFNNLKEILL